MPNSVSLQADIGVLGLSGLGAFTTILSAMSRDNVQPMAMMLLENLGSLFHVNGPYSSRVPEAMTRVTSHPVGRLSLAVGWRRGDAISVFAETAGGQAITLLATCLVNIYEDRNYGLVLSRLCTSLLPKSLPSSSATQLADIARLIAAKAGQLSFGNVLAQQTHRVLSVYQQLQVRPPEDLLEIPSVESIIQLFECLAYLRMDKHLIRISGSTGILYIAAIILFMFPSCTLVAVESMVLHSNEDNRIIIEVSGALTKIQVEKELGVYQTLISTSVEPLARHHSWIEPWRTSLLFDGWLSEALCLHLGRFGVLFTGELRGAFCEFMTQITPHLRLSDFGNVGRFDDNAPCFDKSFKDLLGQHHQGDDPVETWKILLEVLDRHLPNLPCSCGWCISLVPTWDGTETLCLRSSIWRIIGSALSSGILCCLLQPQGVVTMDSNLDHVILKSGTLHGVLQRLGLETDIGNTNSTILPKDVYMSIIEMVGDPSDYNPLRLGISSRGSSIYPRVLDSFRVQPDGSFNFFISEGMFIHNETYYEVISGESELSKNRPTARPAVEFSPFGVSRLWEPLSLTASVRDGFGEILVRLNVNVTGFYFDVSPINAVVGSMYLDTAQGCGHDIDVALQENYQARVSVGTVGITSKNDGNVTILMTRGDRQAQFLACGSSEAGRGLLLSRCCLNCGVRQALENGYHSLIVT
ncbi:hypothetical protein G7054_g7909 [Neopestalotiopsis clavispora]|nr:hypothetical protein G7054_g7909 [Neopestalotiopsis clavispora]